MTELTVLPMHAMPADKMFKVFVSDARSPHIALWFKCQSNGDLFTKPMAAIGKVTKGKGTIVDGSFQLSDILESVKLTGNEKQIICISPTTHQ